MQAIEQHPSYLFIFAHPDDEVYTAGLMNRLCKAGKNVMAAFVTSGDAGVNAADREAELAWSMSAIGIPDHNIKKLRVPELSLTESLPSALAVLSEMATSAEVECIIGMDYEGGHIVHDASSLLASKVATEQSAPFYTFPVYHIEDGQRKAAEFLPVHVATDIIALSPDETKIKVEVLSAHTGQAEHFQRLHQVDSTYFDRLYERELYRQITEPIDYGNPAALELGYGRSGNTFDDFRVAASTLIE